MTIGQAATRTLAALLFSLIGFGANAQSYPNKAVKGIVGFSAGGQIDTIARLVAHKVSETWGQQLVIENRPGAGSNIGAEVVSKSPPDGYTLYFATQAVATNPVLMKTGAVDPIRTLAPVSMLAKAEAVLMVHSDLPVRTVKELVQYAKSRPGELNFATTSVGSPAHVGMELLNNLADIKMESILYKTVPQAVSDVTSGRVRVWMTLLSVALPHIQSGRLRAIGVTGSQRLRALPDVPTIKQSGYPTFESSSWYGVFVPAGTPGDVIVKLSADFRRAILLPDVRERLAGVSIEAVGSTPEQLGAHVTEEMARVHRLVKAGVLTPN